MTLAPTRTLRELAAWLATFGCELRYGATRIEKRDPPGWLCLLRTCDGRAPESQGADMAASTRNTPHQQASRDRGEIEPWEPADFQVWDGGAE